MKRLLAALLLAAAFAAPAMAGPSADLFTRHSESGTLAEGIAAIAGSDAEANAARGALRVLQAIEHAGQSLHKHGLMVGGGARMGLPVLRIPVPPNAEPEPLDYPKFRAIFTRLVDELTAAEADLARVGDAQVKLPLDLVKVRLDLDGNGKADDYESLGAMLGGMMRTDAPAATTVAFDTADIYWLRGYASFLSGFWQFLLAHDFQPMFDKTFHLYFPAAGLPYGEALLNEQSSDPYLNGDVGDVIAMIHLINWKVVEPERRKDTRLRLIHMAEMSRKSWAAARAETDNDREWLPNAKQTAVFAAGPVTDEVIDGWLNVMKEFEAVLDGSKYLPHWRFSSGGLNMKRFFEGDKGFDLVLMLTGTDAILWLDNGVVSNAATWDNLMGAFRGNFLGYAVWFN
jgi:hypothetical protein